MYDDDLELEVLKLRKRRLDLLRYEKAVAGSMTRTELATLRDEARAEGNGYLARLLDNHLRGRVEMETAAL